MKWQPSYATGDAEIDRQHKALFETVQDYREVLSEGAGKNTYDGFLEFLQVYVQAHFGYEENCMHSARCPVAGRNKKEHAAFIKMLEKEVEVHAREGFSHARATVLLDSIDNWLASHICRVDVRLRDFINTKKRNSGAE